MKLLRVKIPWREGLHLRPAAQLVRMAQSCRSSISVKAGRRIADARSILAIMLLCASLDTTLDFEISGADEDAVMASVSEMFDGGEALGSAFHQGPASQ